MPTFTYNKEAVQQRLQVFPDKMRIAFGLSCCERMLRNYVAFKHKTNWGDERPLKEALDALWNHLQGHVLRASEAKVLYEACENAAPDADDFSVSLVGPAQEACFSICSVLDYVQGQDVERIAQASAFAIDTLDLYVQEVMDAFSNTPKILPRSPEREERIRLHPLMQRELERQDADLNLLATNPDIGTLKSQWRVPAKSNIDL